jgi:tetratricopeptide (TPR) repeat protein
MDAARRYTEQALAIVERRGNPAETAFISGNLGSILLTIGDWEAASGQLERAMALIGETRLAAAVSILEIRGQLALCQGRWEEAELILDEALAVCQRTGEGQALGETQALLAELEVLTRRPARAIGRLEALARGDDPSLSVFPPLAWALLEAGEVERADAEVTEGIRRARAIGQRLDLVGALRVHGMIRVRQKRWDEAEGDLQEGLELARSLPFPYEEGRFLYQLGLLEQQRGEPARAQQQLEGARTIFRRLGAQKDLEQAEARLQRLGQTAQG